MREAEPEPEPETETQEPAATEGTTEYVVHMHSTPALVTNLLIL